jgi:hypothetical protein
MRNLASIQVIKSLSPIPGADKIEKAEVLGWELVVKKSEFNVGDKVIYVEIDSVLPELSPFEFMRSRKFRVKTIKLKSQISQGIAFPLSVLTEVDPSFDITKLKIGDDVTEALKITKHDPEAELDTPEPEAVKKTWLQKKWSYWKWKLFGFKPSKAPNGFPTSLCPKTDETRVQNMGSALEKHVGERLQFSEKVEGQSVSYIYRNDGNWLARLLGQQGSFLACSRNCIVYNSRKSGDTSHRIMKVALKYDIQNKMKRLARNLAIQGELIGPGVQSNIYKLDDHDIRVFLIWDIDKQQYLPYAEMVALLEQLELPMVPFLGFEEVKPDIKYYVELSKGKSKLNPSVLREGIVCRSTTNGSFSFKSINPNYLLEKEKDEA